MDLPVLFNEFYCEKTTQMEVNRFAVNPFIKKPYGWTRIQHHVISHIN